MSHGEREECFTPTPRPTQAKRVKPILPAIPRALERRPKKDTDKMSKTSDISTLPVKLDPVVPQANSSEKTLAPANASDCRGFLFPVEEQELEIDLGTLKIEGDESMGQSSFLRHFMGIFYNKYSHIFINRLADCLIAIQASPSKRSTQDFGIERHGFQLPPPFYPAHSRPIVESATQLETEERYQLHTLATFSHRIDYGITFGGYAESDQSSPTLPPSTISTAFPQPTPPSDVTSSPNHSAYQGYGHTPRSSIPALPSISTPQPYDFCNSQPMFVPLDYGYNTDPVSYKNSVPYMVQSSQSPFNPSATPFKGPAAQYSLPTQVPLPDSQYGIIDSSPGPAESNQHDANGAHLVALLLHLSQQFDQPEYADCELEIQVGNQSAELKLHALLIGFSPTMRGLFDSATGPSESGRTRLSLYTSDEFVTVPAIISTLRVCYGQPPPDGLRSSFFDVSNSSSWTSSSQSNEANLKDCTESALAYLVAGHLLQLPEVCFCAIESIERCLAYETLEKILSFAIDGFTYPIDETANRNPTHTDEEEDLTTLGRVSYAPYSGFVLVAAVHFIVANFPTSFVLDISAPTFMSLNQFPVTESPHSRNRPPKSKFGSIKFGDFPLENHELPKEDDTLFSSTLFSVPFLVLMHILGGLEDSVEQKILRPVIEERERRRLIATQKRKALEVREEYGIWINGSWEESIVGSEPNLKATRRWLGA